MKTRKSLALFCSVIVASSGFGLVATTAVAAPSVQVEASLVTASKTMYTNTKAKVRSGPGTNYNVVKTLPAGTKVTVTKTENGWSKVTGGWIRSDLLTSKKVVTQKADGCGGSGCLDKDRKVYANCDVPLTDGMSMAEYRDRYYEKCVVH